MTATQATESELTADQIAQLVITHPFVRRFQIQAIGRKIEAIRSAIEGAGPSGLDLAYQERITDAETVGDFKTAGITAFVWICRKTRMSNYEMTNRYLAMASHLFEVR